MQFWKSRNERSRAGKLLLLDRADPDTIQIFFDDNIGYGSAHIVDVRDASSGEPLAFQVSMLLQACGVHRRGCCSMTDGWATHRMSMGSTS